MGPTPIPRKSHLIYSGYGKTTDPYLVRLELNRTNSGLYKALCDPGTSGGACRFKSVLNLPATVECAGKECSVDTAVLVKLRYFAALSPDPARLRQDAPTTRTMRRLFLHTVAQSACDGRCAPAPLKIVAFSPLCLAISSSLVVFNRLPPCCACACRARFHARGRCQGCGYSFQRGTLRCLLRVRPSALRRTVVL